MTAAFTKPPHAFILSPVDVRGVRGVAFVKRDGDKAVYTLGSGTHEFTVGR